MEGESTQVGEEPNRHEDQMAKAMNRDSRIREKKWKGVRETEKDSEQ